MAEARIHFFDMDHTLTNSDCDVTWKQFMVKHRYAPESDLALADKYFDDYNAGTLNPDEFTRFQLREVIGKTPEEAETLSLRHFTEFVRPKIYPKAAALIAELQKNGKEVVILSSTCDLIIRPLADLLGVRTVFGTPWELKDGKYTGNLARFTYAGVGKVIVAQEFCDARRMDLKELAYYGDSINDAEILRAVGFPHAVNPSAALRELAEKCHWPILSFR